MGNRPLARWRGPLLSALLAVLLAVGPAGAAIFTDIQGLPMQRAIERLAAKGIFRGASATTFNPSGAVTRGEFAVLLVRALGLDAQAAALPAFKDAAEIPRDQAPAIAALANMGTVSPQKVELQKGPVLYTLAVDKRVYGPSERLRITFSMQNTSDQDLKFEYSTNLFADFVIRTATGEEVARWSIGQAFLPVSEPVPLAARQKIDLLAKEWKQLDQSDDPVPPGRYEIVAIHNTKANPTQVSLFFNKGVMGARPDGTFRPKEQLSRLELATVTARALGLGDAAVEGLGAADIGAVPAADRGTVAAAVESRILALVGREVRPAERATRAQVAQALDVVMETLKRYNFLRGTLKDPIAGNPPQLTIEDERKALRTYRVAPVYHAVYRNGRLAELKDLRPGDVVQFLTAGEVGDVRYIEATGR
ncbi:MAG TPA: S-layer homology domain-containing protein [bacterium]|nr:S-layer homology domain-containing protein [bacterium]